MQSVKPVQWIFSGELFSLLLENIKKKHLYSLRGLGVIIQEICGRICDWLWKILKLGAVPADVAFSCLVLDRNENFKPLVAL